MKIIVCTPAGRRKYLNILKQYILSDPNVHEWHLWQNCRNYNDLEYVRTLARENNKVRLIEIKGSDGTNRSVNGFYSFCNDPDVFYVKMDDDIVYIHPKAILNLFESAIKEKDFAIYWSPFVVNNAICSAVLSAKGVISTTKTLSLTAQASDYYGWRSPLFCRYLHETFLESVENGLLDQWLDDYVLSLGAQRFSINCIGFFGETVLRLGDQFCPLGVDDEEHISAKLPIITGLPGRLIGRALVVHYSFFTQEYYLNRFPEILARYAKLAKADDIYDNVYDFDMIGYIKRLWKSSKYYLKNVINNDFGLYLGKQKKAMRISMRVK